MQLQLSKYDFDDVPRLKKDKVRRGNQLLSVLPGALFKDAFSERLATIFGKRFGTSVKAGFEGHLEVTQALFEKRFAQQTVWLVLELDTLGRTCFIDIDRELIQHLLSQLVSLPAIRFDLNFPLTELERAGIMYTLLGILSECHLQDFGLSARIRSVILPGEEGAGPVHQASPTVTGLGYYLNYENVRYGFRIWLPQDVLEQAQADDILGTEAYLSRYGQQLEQRMALFARCPAEVYVEAGRIDLSADDIARLEVDDIIVFDQCGLSAQDNMLSGELSCYVGQKRKVQVIAQYEEHAHAPAEVGIEQIHIIDMPDMPRWMMVETTTQAFSDTWATDEAILKGLSNNLDDRIDASQQNSVECGMSSENMNANRFQMSEPDDFDDFDDLELDEQEPDSGSNMSEEIDEDMIEPVNMDHERAALAADVPVSLVVELGRVELSAADLMRVRPGIVIELNRQPGAPVDLVVGDRRIGKGEIVQIEGELGVRILSIADGA